MIVLTSILLCPGRREARGEEDRRGDGQWAEPSEKPYLLMKFAVLHGVVHGALGQCQ